MAANDPRSDAQQSAVRAHDAFEVLKARIRACRHCVGSDVAQPLAHAPNPIIRGTPEARLCIASQAAGNLAHQSSTPFNDPSGVRLRAWMGVEPYLFYDERRIAIVPMGFCFPGVDAKGGDRPPRRECAPLWRSDVFRHLPNLELVLLVGRYAQAWHLGPTCPPSLTETVRQWDTFLAEPTEGSRPAGVSFLPLPHPSWRNTHWLKQNPFFEKDVLPVLRARVAQAVTPHAERRRGA